MKKTILLCSFAAIVAFVAGFAVCQNTTSNLIQAYSSYNKATEELLDTLENQYNWVDAIDSYDYYESRAKLDSLLWEAN